MFENSKSKYKIINGVITPGISFESMKNKLPNCDLNKVMNSSFIMWQYFFNKAIYSYYVRDNLECILNAAMTVESFLVWKLKISGKYDDYLKYTKSKKSVGFESICSFIKKENVIESSLLKKIRKSYNPIKLLRNNIIHGNVSSPYIDNEKTMLAYNCVMNIFSSLDRKLLKENEFDVPSKSFEIEYAEMCAIIRKCENDIDGAIIDLSKKIEDGIFVNICYFNRALCYYKKDDFGKSISDFNYCISNNYRVVESYNYVGLQYLNCGGEENLNEALKNFTLAIKNDMNCWYVYRNRADCYSCLKDYEKAIKDLDYCIDKNFDNQACYYNLRAANKFKLKLYPDAINDANCCIKLNSNMFYSYIIKYKSYFCLSKTNDISYDELLNCYSLCSSDEEKKTLLYVLLDLSEIVAKSNDVDITGRLIDLSKKIMSELN